MHDALTATPPRLPLRIGVAIWVSIAAIFLVAVGSQYLLLGESQPLWAMFWDSGAVFLLYGAAAPLGLAIYRRLRPATGATASRILPALMGWVVFHLVVQCVFSVLEQYWIAPLRGDDASTFLETLRWHGIRRIAVSLLTFLGCVGFIEHRRASWELAREQQRAAVMRQELVEARLAALRGQLQPHFLFNTLNTIAALLRTDPPAAERMVERLSDLLRAALTEGGAMTIPLRRELQLVDDYLSIHAARFPDRFAYRLDVPDELADVAIPPLLLQPLVENAIRHGLEDKLGPGSLTVGARALSPDRVQIIISDDGEAHTPRPGAGTGLANVRHRLEAIYGAAASLLLSPRQAGGMDAIVTFPLTPPAAEAQ